MKSFDQLMISRRQALSLGLSGVAAFALTACGGSGSTDSSASNSGATVYKIATDTTFAPFEYAEADGTYVGIDVDLLAAVAADQGFEYELQPLGFDAALQAVQASQADGVIAGMSITDERKEIFDFSEPYYDSTVCAAAKNGSGIKSLDDLKDKTVAVKTGTMSEKWAESIKEQYGFTTVAFDTSDVMYQDVVAGNTACCFEDTPVMSYAISTGNVDLKLIAEAASTSEFATPYGFAVNKGANAELLSMFNAGLANVKQNGTYDEIVSKYVQTVE
ncbi:MAG: transporter substrate-binding domain-containing protein [Atopobiaceae bacterium]|nr:transporter substrate-binding domain-containing protein [Atopobiaceae bacterium]